MRETVATGVLQDYCNVDLVHVRSLSALQLTPETLGMLREGVAPDHCDFRSIPPDARLFGRWQPLS